MRRAGHCLRGDANGVILVATAEISRVHDRSERVVRGRESIDRALVSALSGDWLHGLEITRAGRTNDVGRVRRIEADTGASFIAHPAQVSRERECAPGGIEAAEERIT